MFLQRDNNMDLIQRRCQELRYKTMDELFLALEECCGTDCYDNFVRSAIRDYVLESSRSKGMVVVAVMYLQVAEFADKLLIGRKQ